MADSRVTGGRLSADEGKTRAGAPVGAAASDRMANRIEHVTAEERLRELASQWDRLAVSDDGTPFMRSAWVLSWWDAYRDDARLETIALWDGDQLVGLFPMCRRGRRIEAMSNWESMLFRPLARDEDARAELIRHALERSPQLSAESVPAGDTLDSLVRASKNLGRLTMIRGAHTSPIVDIGGSFEDYRESKRPKWMKRLASYRRKMEREHDFEMTLIEQPAELGELLEESFALEASGWKGEAGTAITSDPRTERFYRLIVKEFQDSGELRFSTIRLDGRLVAFDMSLLVANRLYTLKLGYDESFKKTVPGLVLRLSMIERCFETGIEANELLGSSEDWKLSFSTSEREHNSFSSYARRPVPAARYAAVQAARWGYRRTLGRTRG
jgi:CelD/BcsL family acetyltransferase involved in cellulose biosynthesis